jgi:hypothetical protein
MLLDPMYFLFGLSCLGLCSSTLNLEVFGTWLSLARVVTWSSDRIVKKKYYKTQAWSRNPYAKTPIPGKPSKSGLIGVWHKDNLYLGTNIIGNENPHPTNIDSRTRSIRMTPRRQLFFDKSFFSSLENHGRKIISPTHTHKVWQTRNFINLNCLTYMSGYAFIYTNSRLK